MSDVMLFGVLRMPYEMAMGSELSRFQFWQRAQEAADRLESADGAPAGQPAPASTGRIPVVESANLVTIRTRLKSAAQAGAPITLSGLSACALYYAMDTGMPMASDDPAPVAARELDVEAERLTDALILEIYRRTFPAGPYIFTNDAAKFARAIEAEVAARSAAQGTDTESAWKAVEKWVGIEAASAKNIGMGGAGYMRKCEKAEREARQAVYGLAAQGTQPESAPVSTEQAAMWSALIRDTNATPCKYPSLRDDLADWLTDKGIEQAGDARHG